MKISLNNMVLASLILSLILPVAVMAKSHPSSSPDRAVGQNPSPSQRLTEAKLGVCQNREAAITKRLTQLIRLANKTQEKFDAIAERVETYYTTKAVPAGKIVSTYDALVVEIATKKTAVQTVLTAAETSAATFSCTSDDPKGQLTQFKTAMQDVKKALHEYRTAVKNLIVAIRSVNGKNESSPSPVASPTVSATSEAQ